MTIVAVGDETEEVRIMVTVVVLGDRFSALIVFKEVDTWGFNGE